MASYIVKSGNIAQTLTRIEEIVSRSGGNVSTCKGDIAALLCEPANRRIRYFYYCDDFEGISVRLYDSRVVNDYPDTSFRQSRILFRAHNLGREGEPTKRELLTVWESSQVPPSGVNTNNPERADEHFATLNEGTMPNPPATPKDLRHEEHNLQRYEPLWRSTYIGDDFFRRFEDTLIDHRQVILEGPPGAGKTWVARQFANWWTSPQADAAPGSEQRILQLHESYGYEDFFQGIRPILLDADGAEISPINTTARIDKLVYRHVDGVFRTICKRAGENSNARFVLIIDEINRGKTSRVFGELLYSLEYRDEPVLLASGEYFTVPNNVYLIGTMNTADKSIALVDYALRRRFKFIALTPYANDFAPVLDEWLKRHEVTNRDQIIGLFCTLNRKIVEKTNEHLVVGHSYFMLKRFEAHGAKEFDRGTLEEIWEQSILPLIGEYLPSAKFSDIKNEFSLGAIETEWKRPRSGPGVEDREP